MTSKAGGNLIAIGIADGVGFLAAVVIEVYLARTLGADGYGAVGFVLAVLALFAFLANFNLHLLLARDVAREPETASHTFAVGVAAIFGLTFVATSADVLYVWLRDGRPELVLGALVAGLATGAQGLYQVPEKIVLGLRRSRMQVPAALITRLALVALTIGFVSAGLGVTGVFLARLAAWALGFVVLQASLRRVLGPPAWSGSHRDVPKLLRRAWPFSLNVLYSGLYLSSDLLVLREFHDDEELGLYKAATLLVTRLPILAHVANQAIYPSLVGQQDHPERAGDTVGLGVRTLLTISVPISLGGLVLAESLLVGVVGAEYQAATLAFLVLMPLVPLRFVNSVFGTALTALDAQHLRTRAVLFAAVFNLLANLAVIPRYGAVGAATTTLITEVLLTGLLWAWLRPRVQGVRYGAGLARALLASLGMCAALLLMPGLSVWVRLAAGILAYGVLLWTLGGIRRDDLSRLARL